MGSKWKNFRQVFTWSGIPEGDGLDWPVRDGCHQYSLTVTGLQWYLKLILPTIQLSAFLCNNRPALLITEIDGLEIHVQEFVKCSPIFVALKSYAFVSASNCFPVFVE